MNICIMIVDDNPKTFFNLYFLSNNLLHINLLLFYNNCYISILV